MKQKSEDKMDKRKTKHAYKRDMSRRAVTLGLTILLLASIATIFHISPVNPVSASATTLTLHQFTIYDSQAGLTAQQLVSYTDAVESGTSSLMKSVHSLDSSYIGLDYCNLAKVSSTYLTTFKSNNWVLKDQYGAYIYETRFGYNFADIGNPSYQQWMANWIYNDITANGYNGVFCDGGLNAYTTEIWEFASKPPINPRTGTFWTDQQLQDAYVSLLNNIRAKLGNSLYIIVNGIWNGNRFQAHKAYMNI